MDCIIARASGATDMQFASQMGHSTSVADPCGEDSVRPDEREAAAGISADDVDELGVTPDVGRLEPAADVGAGHDQHVASAAEQVMQPGRSVLATDLEVGEPVSGLRPAAVTVGWVSGLDGLASTGRPPSGCQSSPPPP
jgi:hypothetical protein